VVCSAGPGGRPGIPRVHPERGSGATLMGTSLRAGLTNSASRGHCDRRGQAGCRTMAVRCQWPVLAGLVSIRSAQSAGDQPRSVNRVRESGGRGNSGGCQQRVAPRLAVVTRWACRTRCDLKAPTPSWSARSGGPGARAARARASRIAVHCECNPTVVVDSAGEWSVLIALPGPIRASGYLVQPSYSAVRVYCGKQRLLPRVIRDRFAIPVSRMGIWAA
jgi:hypothetical protein